MVQVTKTVRRPGAKGNLPIKLPPRPEQLGMGSVSGVRVKPLVFQQFGPKSLQHFRDSDSVRTAVVWEERENHKGEDGKFSVRVKCWHLLYTGDQGQVVHGTLTRDQAHHPAVLVPMTANRTTPEEFEEYLRGRLRRFGGRAEVWGILGLERPPQESASLPASRGAHDAMYQRAAELLKVPEADLRKRYGHLNPGLQQMNLRNRLRGKGFNV